MADVFTGLVILAIFLLAFAWDRLSPASSQCPRWRCHGNELDGERRRGRTLFHATATAPADRFGSEDPERRPRDEMALKAEGVVYGSVHAEEALCRARRFEALHLALSSPHDLMRVFGRDFSFWHPDRECR